MRLGIDLDGVVHDFSTAFINAVKDTFNVALQPSTSWGSFSDQLKALDRMDIWEFMWDERGLEVGVFDGKIYHGAKEALTYLAGRTDLVLITARPSFARSKTYGWLARYDLPFDEVHVLHLTPKSTVPVDVLVEDAEHNALEVAGNSRATVLLYDRPWNQGLRAQGRVIRVKDWDEVIEKVEGML